MADTSDGILIPATPAPGRVRGEWSPDVVYVRDDLVCIRHLNPIPDEPTIDSWYVCVKRSLNCHPETSDDRQQYWELSPWANITEEFTQPDYRYQRVHSINPEMVDEYILGKGVPAWYYFDMLGFFNTRTQLRNVVDLLTTMRGTIIGAMSFLNLINLHAEINRLAPEELYLFPDDDEDDEDKLHTDLSRELAWRGYMKKQELGYWDDSANDWNLNIKLARVWHSYIECNQGDLVYYNVCDADGKYIGCHLYKARKTVALNDGEEAEEPSGTAEPTDVWEWVCGYAVKPMTALQIPSSTDNSRYELMISQLAGRDSKISSDGRLLITDAMWQQIYTCHYARLIEFLVPAWIRVESGIWLLDQGGMAGAKHASTFNFIMTPDFEGIAPYTLTVLPHIGDMGNIVSVTRVFDVPSDIELDELDQSAENDRRVLNGDIPGYFWREPYMHDEYPDAKTLKVRLLAFKKVKLKSRIERGSPQFWRWSLLNSYHYLPHFRVSGIDNHVRWMDLEPYTWEQLQTLTWENLDGRLYATYSACSQGG